MHAACRPGYFLHRDFSGWTSDLGSLLRYNRGMTLCPVCGASVDPARMKCVDCGENLQAHVHRMSKTEVVVRAVSIVLICLAILAVVGLIGLWAIMRLFGHVPPYR